MSNISQLLYVQIHAVHGSMFTTLQSSEPDFRRRHLVKHPKCQRLVSSKKKLYTAAIRRETDL